jgi:tight adherence protein B
MQWSAYLLLGLGAWGCLREFAASPAARARFAAYEGALAVDLSFVQSSWSARRVIGVQTAVCLAAVLTAAWCTSPGALALIAPAWLVPRTFLARRRALRIARMEAQLDTWLTTLANALKANPSLPESVQSSVALTAEPLRSELDLVLKSHRLGTPFDRALRDMSARVASRVISSALATLRIARQTGGNLSATLEASAASLRELARLEGVVRARTAEGRAQSLLIGSLPAALFVVLDIADPGFLAPLFESSRGHVVLGVAAILWIAAFAWSRRIVAVDV